MMGVDWTPERFRERPGIHRDDRLAGGSVDPHTHLQEGGGWPGSSGSPGALACPPWGRGSPTPSSCAQWHHWAGWTGEPASGPSWGVYWWAPPGRRSVLMSPSPSWQDHQLQQSQGWGSGRLPGQFATSDEVPHLLPPGTAHCLTPAHSIGQSSSYSLTCFLSFFLSCVVVPRELLHLQIKMYLFYI